MTQLPGNAATGVKNLFVSFTTIEKLGVNPQSEYDTPLGIYAYPAQYAIKVSNAIKSEDFNELPFAGNSPFLNIFEVTGNIINVSNMSSTATQKYYKKLGTVYSNYYMKVNPTINKNIAWKKAVDELEKTITTASSFAKNSSPGGQFWYVIMTVVRKISRMVGDRNPSVVWNKVMREIGIDGVVDMGKGIIHSNEPTQAVFFHSGVIKNNKRYDNKWSKKDIETGKYVEMSIEGAKKLSKEPVDVYEKVISDGFKNYKSMNMINSLQKIKVDNKYHVQIFFSNIISISQKRVYFNELIEKMNIDDFVDKLFMTHKYDNIVKELYQSIEYYEKVKGSSKEEKKFIDMLNKIADRLVPLLSKIEPALHSAKAWDYIDMDSRFSVDSFNILGGAIV